MPSLFRHALSLFVLLMLASSCFNQAAVIQPAAAVERQQPDQPAIAMAPVTWGLIATQKEFWKAIYSAPRVVVLFGTTTCAPCHGVKAWWEEHAAPVGWKFYYWELDNENNPDDHEGFHDICGSFAPEHVGYTVPILSVIEHAKPGALIRDVVSAEFCGGNHSSVEVPELGLSSRDATDGLRYWLLQHPSGLHP